MKEAACPIWICVVGRPTFGRGRTAWAGRAARRQEITLPALEPAAAAELARRLLTPVESVPAGALGRLAERTQGIPLLLVELVRGLKRDGLVRKSEKTNAWYLATDELDKLPDLPLVQWLASRETESLPPDLLAHARLASMLGSEFSTDELEGVMQELERAGAAPDTQLDASIGVSRLAESGLLVRHRGGQGVAPAQREIIHRAAYDHFKRQDRLPESTRLPQMAFHASRSGLKEEAGRLYLDLAKRMLARHAYLDAELLYKNALENLPETDEEGQIAASRGRALMRFRLGRHEDASKDFEIARTRAHKVSARLAEIELMLDQAIVLDWLNQWKQSAALTTEAEALAKSETLPPSVNARMLMALGRTPYRGDELRPALELLTRAVDAAAPMLRFTHPNLGQFDEALQVSERIQVVGDEHNDAMLLSWNCLNRGLLYFLLGRVDELVADYRRSIQITREYGFPMLESLATKDLGEVMFYVGRPDDAEPLAQRAAELYTMIQGEKSPRVAYSEVLLARSKAYRGDLDGARATVERIMKKQAEIQAEGGADSALPSDGKAQLEGVALWVRGASDDEFDALIAHGRAFPLQAADIIEIMEWKALSAIRTGRRSAARSSHGARGELGSVRGRRGRGDAARRRRRAHGGARVSLRARGARPRRRPRSRTARGLARRGARR